MNGRLLERVREEWEALGLMSYHGSPSSPDGKPWFADLTVEDVEGLRRLLREVGERLAGLEEVSAAEDGGDGNGSTPVSPGDAGTSSSADAAIPFPVDGLWSEDGDRVWLSLDYAPNATRVKRLFYAGRGIPTCPARDGAWYPDLRVSRAFIRPGEEDETGWAGSGADTWWRCLPEHPRAVEAWEISYAGSDS